PMTQPGALRLAKALDNRLPTLQPRDDQAESEQPLYRHLIAFTWPTTHRISGYLADKEEIARASAFSLANFISDLRATGPSAWASPEPRERGAASLGHSRSAAPSGSAAGGNPVSALSASPRTARPALPGRRILL